MWKSGVTELKRNTPLNYNCLRWYTQRPVPDPGTRGVWEGWQERTEEHWSHPVCPLRWRGHTQSMTHMGITFHVPHHQYVSKGEPDLLPMLLFIFFLSTGLHQFGHRRAKHLRVSLVRPLSQQQSSLERDGEAAHPYWPFQRVPSSLWVQALLKWVTTAAHPDQPLLKSKIIKSECLTAIQTCVRHDIMMSFLFS